MIYEAKITQNELFEFIERLRFEDKLEFENYLKANSLQGFIDSCFEPNNEVYFLKALNGSPLALGGVRLEVKNVYKIGQIWLLVTQEFYLHKKQVMNFVFNKIDEFKSRFDFLYNYIYKSNFSSLKWLKRLGFKVCDVLDNQDYKLFYFSKGAYFDIRYSPSK